MPFLIDGRASRRLELAQNGDALCFKSETSALPKVAIISTPKAGTYLLSAMLCRMGWVDTEIHAADHAFTDYRGLSDDQKRQDPEHLLHHIPLNVSSGLVLPGQIIVGHIPPTEFNKRCLDDFKTIFIHREMRASLVSWMRFLIAGNRHVKAGDEWRSMPKGPEQVLAFIKARGSEFFRMAELPALWAREARQFSTSFETVMGDHGEAAQETALAAMLRYLDVDPKALDLDKLLSAVGKSTKTFSGQRTEIDGLWLAETEQIFIEQGGYNINGILGIS